MSKDEAYKEPRVLAAIQSLVLPTLPHLAMFYLSDALLLAFLRDRDRSFACMGP